MVPYWSTSGCPSNFPPLDFHSQGIQMQHSYYARRAPKCPIWNRMYFILLPSLYTALTYSASLFDTQRIWAILSKTLLYSTAPLYNISFNGSLLSHALPLQSLLWPTVWHSSVILGWESSISGETNKLYFHYLEFIRFAILLEDFMVPCSFHPVYSWLSPSLK